MLKRQVWTLIVCLVLAVGLRLVWGESAWKITGKGQIHGFEPTERVTISAKQVCVVDAEGNQRCINQPPWGLIECYERLYDALQEVWERQWNERGAAGYWSHAREAKVQAVLKDCKPEER